MSNAIHLDRGLILFDNGAGGAANAAVNTKAETAGAGVARECDVRQPSASQEGGTMTRPLWIYYEHL